MHKQQISEELIRRWGSTVMADGFQAVPHRLLRHQAELKLTPSEMVVLLNVLDFWWTSQRRPFPSAASIARRTAASERTVRRHLSSLQKKGYLAKSSSADGDKREFDPTGLIHRLTAIIQKGNHAS